MLTLTGVTKAFSNRRVLDRLDLEIGAGESVAMLGANGSGKTTTLRCSVGLARPDAGRIVIGGIDLARDPIRARSRLSYLPQKSVFPPTLTVRETLAVVARLRGLACDAADREIASCGLSALADRGVGHLSGGERQRLAMAVAFLPTVDLYLFDEPSANLDPVASPIGGGVILVAFVESDPGAPNEAHVRATTSRRSAARPYVRTESGTGTPCRPCAAAG